MAGAKREAGGEQSAARRAARQLRTRALTLQDGEFMGSEDELVAALGVSRPTFRQAAKLVEQEQLMRIRRGVGGGFFAMRPSSKAVAHTTAVYLQARQSTLQDAIEASRPLFAEAARLGATRRDKDVCAQLKDFLKGEAEALASRPDDFREFLRSEREFGAVFAAASGNPLLELYLLVLYDFAASLQRQSIFYKRPERMNAYRDLRNRIARAIVDGDASLAVALSDRLTEVSVRALAEDHADGSKRRMIRVGAG